MSGRQTPLIGKVQHSSGVNIRSISWLLLSAMHGVASMLMW